jgi:tRNA pseudouridine38-40 synthase
MRYAVALEYDGALFGGWQKQTAQPNTLQAHLEAAISQVAAHPVEVICAGRTDKGVHAAHQVIHFDTNSERSDYGWRMGIQSHLPRTMRIKWLQTVPPHFHARYSALARRYRYFIRDGQAQPALLHQQITWVSGTLDASVMHEAAQCLVGEHDFSSFRASQCQSKTPFRNLHHISVTRYPNFICMDIQGNAFLHHMVRNIMGCLLLIGQHSKPTSWLQTVLEAKDRRAASMTAPPHGLYLVDVIYKDDLIVPSSPIGPWFLNQV